ncbi:MAG: group 1 truncated hemoglobin [Cyanobacteriota bacterium]|nr:group 1 truncated hemoglobin [Cyanobacteriota bacterium]
MATLYEQIGGAAAVQLAVDNFYQRVMADSRINHFFAGVDMQKQRAHQVAFLTYAFGGSSQYDGRSMQKAHERLVQQMGLTDTHYDAVVENLVATLQELQVAEPLIGEVGQLAESIRKDVLSQSAS